MKKLVRLSATPALIAGMTAFAPGAADAQSLLDGLNFHVGATGGVLSGDADFEDQSDFGGTDTESTDADLGILSVIAGIDHRMESGMFLGVEGDIGLPVGDYPNDEETPSDMKWSDMNYNAHLRGRVGARLGQVDVFVAAGLAVAEFEQEHSDGDDKTTLTGLSLGAGVDWFFMDSLAVRLEILRDDYGRKNTRRVFNEQYSGDWTDTTVRGGLLFQF
jgi:opacity protein-like surface antigen